jgi:hypothetical protein
MKWYPKYQECARCDFFCLTWDEMAAHVQEHYRQDKAEAEARRRLKEQRELQPGEFPR